MHLKRLVVWLKKMTMKKNNPQTFQERLEKVQDDLLSRGITHEETPFKSMAYGASCDMIAALVVGCALGLMAESFFPLSPWGIILGFFLGAIAGLFNVYKSLVKIGYGLEWDKVTTLIEKKKEMDNG